MALRLTRLRAEIRKIARLLEAEFGRPEPEPADALETLVEAILSQNTNDLNRDRAYRSLRRRWPTWEVLARARPQEVAREIRVGGLAQAKSRSILSLFRHLRRTRGSYDLAFLSQLSFAEAREFFRAVKGIGVKSLAVTYLFGLGREVFPVDTHIHRVAGRLGLVPQSSNRERSFVKLSPAIPEGKSYSLHINLIRLGRAICQARRPRCELCPLQRECPCP